MSRAPALAAKQQGAALAIALLMLVIITLLGVAAVRATQVELRLSQNAESHMAATQAAESMVSFVATGANLPVNEDDLYTACVLPAGIATALFSCANASISTATANTALQAHGYALLRRESPLFVEVNVLREAELSAKDYDFARFTVTGGYDRSAEGMSAAEITVGLLRLHAKIAGVNYEP